MYQNTILIFYAPPPIKKKNWGESIPFIQAHISLSSEINEVDIKQACLPSYSSSLLNDQDHSEHMDKS
jgi:hypothetical protein